MVRTYRALATPSEDGWHLCDFIAFYHVLHELSAHRYLSIPLGFHDQEYLIKKKENVSSLLLALKVG